MLVAKAQTKDLKVLRKSLNSFSFSNLFCRFRQIINWQSNFIKFHKFSNFINSPQN